MCINYLTLRIKHSLLIDDKDRALVKHPIIWQIQCLGTRSIPKVPKDGISTEYFKLTTRVGMITFQYFRIGCGSH